MNKKKLIKYILLGMWIVYMCVGVYCFIQNENSKDNATTEVQDDNLTVTPTTDSVADKNTDTSQKLTHTQHDKSNTSEHKDNGEDDDEKEARAHEMGEIEGYEVTNFDDQVPGDEYEPEFVEGDRPDPELYIQDDDEKK